MAAMEHESILLTPFYALSHGASAAEVEVAIRSRDLSHKGNERRQNDYVERTIKKALATIDRGR